MPASHVVRWLPVALFLAAALSLTGLASAGPDPLVGQWRYPGGSVMEFTVDGVLLIKNADGTPSNRMRYWTEEGSTLVMMQDDDQTMTTGYQISANGKRLVLDSMGEGKKKAPDVLERVR